MDQINTLKTLERIADIVNSPVDNSLHYSKAPEVLTRALGELIQTVPEQPAIALSPNEGPTQIVPSKSVNRISMAKTASRAGKLADATKFVQSVLRDENLTDIRTRAIATNQLGVIRRMQRQYIDADISFNHALIDFKTLQDYHSIAESLNNLGLLHFRKLDFPRAQKFLDKSQAICAELHHQTLLAFVFLNKTEFFCAIKDYEMAAQMCVRGLRLLVQSNLGIGLAKVCLLMARIFWKCHHIQTAKELYLESIRLYSIMEIPLGKANSFSEFAVMLKESGALNQAEIQFRNAEQELTKLEMDRVIV